MAARFRPSSLPQRLQRAAPCHELIQHIVNGLILIWEDGQGKLWVTYNSPAYLQERHGSPAELLPNISVIEALAKAVAE